MADSNITVSGLVAVPAVGQVKLAWTYTDPHANGWPHSQLDAVEVWAASTNSRTGAAKVGEGRKDFVHSGIPEETTRYYWIKARNRSGLYSEWYPAGATAGVSARAIGKAGLAFTLGNGQITAAATVSGGLLIALKTSIGADPSLTDSIYMAYPRASTGSGGYEIGAITDPVSLTVQPSEFLDTHPSRANSVWLVLVDAGDGSQVLAAINCNLNSQGKVVPLSDLAICSTITSTAKAGDFYANVALTDRPYRIIGRLIWFAGDNGDWRTPDQVLLRAVDMKLPGDTVQHPVRIDQGLRTAITTVLPQDGTQPQITEGDRVWSGVENDTITPTCAANLIRVSINAPCTLDGAGAIGVALFRDGAAGAIAADFAYAPGADLPTRLICQCSNPANTEDEIEYEWRAGPAASGSLKFNALESSGVNPFGLDMMGIVTELEEIVA